MSIAPVASRLDDAQVLQCLLAGGDDYELCFTAPTNARESIEDLTDMLGVPLTRIGEIRKGKGVSLVAADGKPIAVDGRGFDHFTAS